ncbi:MAG TPA: energy-coupling factor transporter transmembrane component T [Solirubrobacteraceae bacterium]|nr:energy-coupling factor transporter transmembrane component T [Solirubrobacteraceae bacterium]
MTYLLRASPLHATRAAVASAWCVVLAIVALSFDHPLVLGALLATVVAAAGAARVGRRVVRSLLFALPFAIVIGLVNPLVVRDGLTVIARLGTVPVFGALDITAEAAAYGGVLALRALVIIGCFALHSAAVDPDDLLRAFRRISFRSALTAALATRLVPVLARDARRLHDAQRCLAGEPAPRRAIFRAVASGALDRAVDVAATLEVRGYGAARHAPRGGGRPWSRHDLAFAASAVGLAATAFAAHLAGVEAFDASPAFSAPLGAQQLALCAVLAGCALLPFADRRGIAG